MEANGKSDFDGSGPLLTQANLCRMRGQWTEAVETCVRLLRSDPGNADAHSLLGDIYRDQGARDDAIQWYRMAADLRPAGPDPDKLARLEAQRDRLAGQSRPLNPSTALGAYETPAGGTTRLMGYSPKRWLNTLTIVSACFLAATILVLAALRMNPGGRPNTVPRTMELSSHSSMPTAETGVALPSVNPNRPTVLPVGEQTKQPARIHQTGDGLEPDRPGTSRTTLPNFSNQPQVKPGISAPQNLPQAREVPPAPVTTVRPLQATLPVGTSESVPAAASEQPQRSIGTVGHVEDGYTANETGSGTGTVTVRPAPDTGAGQDNPGSGARQPEQ